MLRVVGIEPTVHAVKTRAANIEETLKPLPRLSERLLRLDYALLIKSPQTGFAATNEIPIVR